MPCSAGRTAARACAGRAHRRGAGGERPAQHYMRATSSTGADGHAEVTAGALAGQLPARAPGASRLPAGPPGQCARARLRAARYKSCRSTSDPGCGSAPRKRLRNMTANNYGVPGLYGGIRVADIHPRQRPRRGEAMLTTKQKELLDLHQRPPAGDRRAALLRRDEGGAGAAVQVGRAPPDHCAGGARLHPPPAAPRARHRGHQAPRRHVLGVRQRTAPHRLQPQRHRGLGAPAAAAAAGLGAVWLRQSRRLQRAPDGPHRRRRADQRHPESHAGHRRAARHDLGRRALRARGEGRLR